MMLMLAGWQFARFGVRFPPPFPRFAVPSLQAGFPAGAIPATLEKKFA
jgi:hypothetical protein